MKKVKTDEFFCGIDPSLTNTGLVIIDSKDKVHGEYLIKTNVHDYVNAQERLIDIFNQTKFIANIVHLKKLCIEGLSYMSVSTTLFERCGLFYLLTTYFFNEKISFDIIPPKSLKKFVTDNGNANKKLMMKIAEERWNYKTSNDNLCDAYGLAQMAKEIYLQRKEQIND